MTHVHFRCTFMSEVILPPCHLVREIKTYLNHYYGVEFAYLETTKVIDISVYFFLNYLHFHVLVGTWHIEEEAFHEA